MKSRLERLLIALFILGSLVLFVWVNLTRPRVMVLHSYDPDYVWTREVNVGLRRVLDGRAHYTQSWHYMDLKRYPWPEYRENAGVQARRAIEAFRPDVLIAVDDDAQKYAAMFFVDDPKMRIVFAGINGGVEPYGYHKAGNVTGILERKQIGALERAIGDLGLAKGGGTQLRVAAIGDRSESVKQDIEFIAQHRWQLASYRGARLVGTFDEWKDAVRRLQSDADVIVTTNYRRLTRSANSRELVPASEVVRWTEENSKIPVIGTNGFFVEDGGMLAIGTSGYEQGEVAAKMTERLLEEKIAPSAIPVASTAQFVVYLRRSLLAKRGIAMPTIYEAFARATNNYFD